MATFSHTKSRQDADAFRQTVPNPDAPLSRVSAAQYSAVHAVKVPIAYNVASVTSFLPIGATITGVTLVVTTAFVGTSPQFKIGSTAGGVDIMPLQSISTSNYASNKFAPAAAAVAASGQKFYTTVSGTGLSAGAGFVIVEYVN